MIKVAIIGGSGYTGLELLRLLAGHTGVKVVSITSRQNAGKPIHEVFPCLKGYYDMNFSAPQEFLSENAEFFFSCLPHGQSMEIIPELLKKGKRIVDLSADFRIKNAAIYEKWYEKHKAKNLLKDAVYGLPELFRDKIKEARLVANPGCYPTGAILALLPLLKKKGLIHASSIIIDAKSGVSGAGRAPSIDTSFVEVASGFKAYKVAEHRHTPEMEEIISIVAGGKITVSFTPHLLPVSRGILSTVYVEIKKTVETHELQELYAGHYKKEPFVNVYPEGQYPDIHDVRGSNYCAIGVKVDERTKRAIIISAIDNLVKGASGQAIQNMNIMNELDEDEGLTCPAMSI